MIQMAGSVAKSWLASELDVGFDHAYYFDAQRRHACDVRCNEYVADVLRDLDVFYTESNLGRRRWYSDDQVLVGGIQPNMIVGMLLGAEFLPADEADADISARCLAGKQMRELPSPAELLEHPLVQRWQVEITRLLDASSGSLQPIPPFFWDASGRAAVHGAVTSGLKYYGDEFLMNLLSDSDASQAVVSWLTEASAVLVDHFAAVGHVAISGIHVGECAACMLDVSSFQRFVVPYVSQLGRRFGSVRFHSCGCSDHLLESCREITGLASLDVGGETSMARIRSVFGPEFPVGIAPLVEDMRADSTGGILKWFSRVQQENAGGDLTIGFHLEAGYRIENLRALNAAVDEDR